MATNSLEVRIDSSLHARLDDLGEHLAAQIRSYLTIANQHKAKALARGDWGAEDMPDVIELWRHVGEDLVMPRGFATILRHGAEQLGHEVRWDDRTVTPGFSLRQLAEMNTISLRLDQETAVSEILRQRQGVLQAPTGGGKTVVGLEAFRRAGVRGLVIVNGIGLAQQWRDRAREHLGIETGLIGDGVWDERALTVAIVQTLYSRRHDLDDDGFWARWGMTIIDECHHALAPTYREILDRTVSRYLLGKTATPLDGDWRRRLLEVAIGPVVHRMDAKVLQPSVLIVKTDFRWVPDKREEGLVDPKAIYRHVIKALEQDGPRLALIADTIMAQPNACAQLVTSDRLGYLERIGCALADLDYPDDRIFLMRGEESRQRRAEIAEAADDGHCAILSTVADEGVDIPRLDRIHLPWPARRADPIVQKIGRLLRDHPLKLPPVAVDYMDMAQGVLRSQAYARINNIYKPRGWKMETEERA